MADDVASPVRQLLVIDAGNTNTSFGFYRGDALAGHVRLSTDRGRTADEMAGVLLPLLAHHGLDAHATDAVWVSSVVPPFNPTLERLAHRYFGQRPHFVTHEADIGLTIDYARPGEIGADRLVNAVAARHHHPTPVIVVDFGTATTFDVIDPRGAYVGGVIAPGLMISAEALFAHASRLYRVDVRQPDQVIGRTTAEAMQSGLYWGAIGQVDGILEQLIASFDTTPSVVATGGLATLVAQGSRFIDEVDPLLTLTGLRLIDAHGRDDG